MAARRSVGRQFILITPQSMGNVDVAGDVKIIKYAFLYHEFRRGLCISLTLYRLSDPERGQTTLPFGG